MDLVTEYLRAVAALLPRAQRDDIVAELRDTILSRIEEREGEMGRPLTDDETEAVLREIGHPLVVAARYREGPQHVVGPTLYPYWLFAVKAGITIQVVLAAIILLVRALSGGNFSQALGQAIGSGVSGTLVLIGAATAAAWLIERQGGGRVAYLDRWKVRDLRFLEIVSWDLETLREWVGARQTQHRRDRAPSPHAPSSPAPRPPQRPTPPIPPAPPPHHHAHHLSPVGRGLFLVAAGTVFVLWWVGVISFGLDAEALQTLGLDEDTLGPVDWAALRATLYWPVLAYWTILILQGALMLAYPRAARLHGLMEAAKGFTLVGFCAWLMTLSPLVSLVGVSNSAQLAERLAMFRQGLPLPLAPIATIVVLVLIVVGLGLIIRGLWTLVAGPPPLDDRDFWDARG